MINPNMEFVLVFPEGMCGKKTINVTASPLSIKDIASQVLKSQCMVFGTICMICEAANDDNVLAFLRMDDRAKIKFYTEDTNAIQQVKETEDK